VEDQYLDKGETWMAQKTEKTHIHRKKVTKIA
jgi:hypothetical protein